MHPFLSSRRPVKLKAQVAEGNKPHAGLRGACTCRLLHRRLPLRLPSADACDGEGRRAKGLDGLESGTQGTEGTEGTKLGACASTEAPQGKWHFSDFGSTSLKNQT